MGLEISHGSILSSVLDQYKQDKSDKPETKSPTATPPLQQLQMYGAFSTQRLSAISSSTH
jgi:hypothetical protein